MSESTFAKCAICSHIVTNPCVIDFEFKVEGCGATQPVPVGPTTVVRAKAPADVLTRQFFCRTMKEMVRRKLVPQEVRGFVGYKIFEGLYHGIRYEHPWGEEMEIGPDDIEDAFDGRPQLALPADVDSWEDEVIASDRGITNALKNAATGEIATAPGALWYPKLMFIRMAIDTPDLDPPDLD